MTKEEIKNYLKDNLRIRVSIHHSNITPPFECEYPKYLDILIDNEVIDSVPIRDLK